MFCYLHNKLQRKDKLSTSRVLMRKVFLNLSTVYPSSKCFNTIKTFHRKLFTLSLCKLIDGVLLKEMYFERLFILFFSCNLMPTLWVICERRKKVNTTSTSPTTSLILQQREFDLIENFVILKNEKAKRNVSGLYKERNSYDCDL